MPVMNDGWIADQCLHKEPPMIHPYKGHQVTRTDSVLRESGYAVTSQRLISYGLSSYGYDIRCADEFQVFSPVQMSAAVGAYIDPKRFDKQNVVGIKDQNVMIPPNSFALARSLEYIRVPRDILVLCIGKSTYARCGIIVNVTPLEPEWEGYITIEISNTAPLPAKVYANEGLVQLLFLKANEECLTSYKDKGGRYDRALGIEGPKV